jgi:Cu(I)/Ag(I) efflux system membrane fusion protein
MNKIPTPVAIFLGFVMGAGLATALWFMGGKQNDAIENSQVKPLYWVAPMDPNYKRDKPGKSPMGMDLIPVFSTANGGEKGGSGSIIVSPEVVNNLGVRTSTVQRKSLHTTIQTVGYVQYNQDRLIHIHPRVQGWVEKLYVKAEGDAVQKEQPLYDLYAPALVNAQEEFVLALDRHNERLIQAAADRLKALQLSDSMIASLRKTRKVSQTITLHSPQSGVVDNLNIREGFFIQPGTTVMSIGSLDEVWVEAEVFERQASLVQVGAAVTMTLDYSPGNVWHGNVNYVYPTLDEKTRTLKVRMRFDNASHLLKPNMFAQVTIHVKPAHTSLIVPREALIRTGKTDRVVLALGNGRFKSIEVRAGRFDDAEVEIIEGLEQGDQIVTSAQFLLDSESSKTSDFKRMNHDDNKSMDSRSSKAEVNGTIRRIDANARLLNVDREAIPKWNRGAANVNFLVAESVDISNLQLGTNIHFVFEITPAREFVITKIDVLDSVGPRQ